MHKQKTQEGGNVMEEKDYYNNWY